MVSLATRRTVPLPPTSRAPASSWSRRATTTASPTSCWPARGAPRGGRGARHGGDGAGRPGDPGRIAILLEAAAAPGRPYDAAVALGCVIRGETGHYDIVAGESARALMDLSVARRLPLGNGILTVETEAQAWPAPGSPR